MSKRIDIKDIASFKATNKGKTIVFTNGCFDILHRGHVEYLEIAKSKGDILIVAVNDNNSVIRLKGKHRPINDLEDRIAVLSALSCVDYILSFSEDTPASIIENINPDILVKGADYKIEDIAGAEYVLSQAGRVELIEFSSGYSTTGLIEKIKSLP